MLGRRGAAVVAVRDEGTHLLRGTAVGLRIDEAVLLRPTDVELTAAECVVLRGPAWTQRQWQDHVAADPRRHRATVRGRGHPGRLTGERHDLTRTTIAALIGAPATYRDLTLVDHLVLIDSTWGRVGQRADDRADEILELLEIDHLAERYRKWHPAATIRHPARVRNESARA